MFGRFTPKPKQTPNALEPESRWVVSFEGECIRVRDHEGDQKTVLKTALSGVMIETTDSGPWGADLWWLLFGADDTLACAYPQVANGTGRRSRLPVSLPGFDHALMVKAMSSTENAAFPVWRKQSDARSSSSR